MRREKYEAEPQGISYQGSPPHAQGKVKLASQIFHGCRITPACAGKRYTADGRRDHGQDHPRMRREKTKKDPKL